MRCFAPNVPTRHLLYRPVVIRDSTERIGDVILKLRLDPEYTEDSVITDDVILLWVGNPRGITGTDLLGRLMRGIVKH
jgi:metal transporter CNNM